MQNEGEVATGDRAPPAPQYLLQALTFEGKRQAVDGRALVSLLAADVVVVVVAVVVANC